MLSGRVEFHFSILLVNNVYLNNKLIHGYLTLVDYYIFYIGRSTISHALNKLPTLIYCTYSKRNIYSLLTK